MKDSKKGSPPPPTKRKLIIIIKEEKTVYSFYIDIPVIALFCFCFFSMNKRTILISKQLYKTVQTQHFVLFLAVSQMVEGQATSIT